MNFFAKNIKMLRLRAGLTQEKAASIIPCSRTAWTQYELGTSKPGFDDLLKIVNYFDITLSELVEMDLSKGNPNEILELRKIVKKGNLKGNVTGNLNKDINGNPEKAHAPDSALEKKLSAMEYELKEMRRKLGL